MGAVIKLLSFFYSSNPADRCASTIVVVPLVMNLLLRLGRVAALAQGLEIGFIVFQVVIVSHWQDVIHFA